MTTAKHAQGRHRSRPALPAEAARPDRRLGAQPADPDHKAASEPARRSWLPLAGAAVLAAGANALVLGDFRLPFLGPAIGFWFIAVFPAYLVYTTDIWNGSPALERLGYSVAAVLLLLMLGGLAINTLLPPLGVARPLDPLPVVILGDVINASLYAFRRRRPLTVRWRAGLAGLRPYETRLLVAAAMCTPLAVLGANRLNNGAGDQLSLAALVVMVVTLFFLLGWHKRLTEPVIGATLYLMSLALLLMTSLRGWSVTGHDIQTEYRVFQLTAAHGRWNISDFHSAYNACLSITILPTEIANVVNVDHPYVYKVFFQVLFALCPVLGYALCRRYAPKAIALLAAIYFIGFPTFFGDMPFLNRQEVAFLFVCAGVLAVTNSRWPQRVRRIVLFGAALGVELSHYSTMYLFLGMMVVGWLIGVVLGWWRRHSAKGARAIQERPWSDTRRTVGLGSVLVLAAMLVLWGGLATQTAGPFLTDVANAISQLGKSSSATPYSLLSRTTLSPQQVLDEYRSSALQQNAKQNAATHDTLYLPLSTVDQYATPLANEPALPLTSLGRLLSRIGVPIETLNTDVRQGAAKDEQLFVAVGFAVFIFSRRLRERISQELLYLCVGAVAMVAVFAVFPNLSVDYGVLRAFQEALILAAPILVIGSVAAFWPFGQKWSMRIAAAVALGIFISTTGLMPQVLGGYPAQLSLNNSGQYYDIYYVHPQDLAAVDWLEGKPGVVPTGLQAPLGGTTANIFAFTDLSDVNGSQFVDTVYPVLTQRSSWVLLSYAIVHTGRAPLYSDGQLIEYYYPTGLLQANKDLVYNNGGDEIYK